MVQEDWAYTMRRTMQVKTALHLQSRLKQASSRHNNSTIPSNNFSVCGRRLCLECIWAHMPALARKWLQVSKLPESPILSVSGLEKYHVNFGMMECYILNV